MQCDIIVDQKHVEVKLSNIIMDETQEYLRAYLPKRNFVSSSKLTSCQQGSGAKPPGKI